MSDIYDAAREVRDAVTLLNANTRAGLLDIRTELRVMVGVLNSIGSSLRDISDVMHAEFYGVKTQEQESGDDED